MRAVCMCALEVNCQKGNEEIATAITAALNITKY